jgi:hypothetical protein
MKGAMQMVICLGGWWAFVEGMSSSHYLGGWWAFVDGMSLSRYLIELVDILWVGIVPQLLVVLFVFFPFIDMNGDAKTFQPRIGGMSNLAT